METKKPQRIEGTRYVKLNDTVYSTVAKDAPTLKTRDCDSQRKEN